MPTRGSPQRRIRRWPGALLLCGTLLLLFSGCSLTGGSGSGSSSLTLGIAGSTADQPVTPPALAQGGPGGTYAFVYDNQVWLHPQGQQLQQLTHLVLSNGANIAWGPIVWSPSGKYIAFSLVQNLNPAQPSAASGPIYVVDTSSGPTRGTTIVTGGTGSLYGHTYVWYSDNMLFYSAGGSIGMFGPYGCDAACDPRTWTVLTPVQAQGGGVYSGQSISYGDLAIANGALYYTQANLQTVGVSGSTGSAGVYQTGIFSLGEFQNALAMSQQDNAPAELSTWLSQHITLQSGGQIADLGHSYAGPQGSVSTGAWALSGNNFVVQHIDNVDTKAGQVSSSFCAYDAYGNCTHILRDAGKASLTATPGLSVAGGIVAYTDGTLYVASAADGSHEAKLANAGWTMPPAVSPDGKTVAATQLVKQSTSASGVVHSDTNVLTSDGSNSLTFVSGGADFSWKS